MKTVIIGHSFVRDLGIYVAQSISRSNLNLSLSERSVEIWGRGGLLLSNLRSYWASVINTAPDVVLLDIGGNDIDCGRLPINVLATHLLSFCRLLLTEYRVKVVVILEVPYRARVCRGHWRSARQLNDAIHRFNSMCLSMCNSFPGQRVRFWHHVGLVDGWQQYLKRDGVHLNKLGMAKYYRSVRSATIRFTSWARAL